MGEYLRMPKLDMSMTKGTVASWLKNEGDTLKYGDCYIEVETGKVSVEVDFTSSDSVLLARYAREGDTVGVGEVIGYAGAAGETAPSPGEAGVISREERSGGLTGEASGTEYDAVVIGSGPAGYAFALEAARLGARILMAEKDRAGGLCLNSGCIPTKSLVKSASVIDLIRRAGEFGVSASLDFADYPAALARARAASGKLRDQALKVLAAAGVELRTGEAFLAGVGTVGIGDETWSAPYVVLATGTLPSCAAFPGDASVPVYCGEEILGMESLPDSVLILGEGTVALEFASIFASFGAAVTLACPGRSVLTRADREVGSAVERSLKARGVAVERGVGLETIKEGHAVLTGGVRIACSAVLFDGPRRASQVRGLDASASDAAGFILTGESMQVPGHSGLYAIGDAAGGGNALAAQLQGSGLASALFSHGRTEGLPVIPECLYTAPEAAWIGLGEEEARASGRPVVSCRKSWLSQAKSVTDGENAGFVKVIADPRYNEILGVHIVGAGACEVIASAALAMSAELTLEELARAPFPHPGFSEALSSACGQLLAKA